MAVVVRLCAENRGQLLAHLGVARSGQPGACAGGGWGGVLAGTVAAAAGPQEMVLTGLLDDADGALLGESQGTRAAQLLRLELNLHDRLGRGGAVGTAVDGVGRVVSEEAGLVVGTEHVVVRGRVGRVDFLDGDGAV